MFKINGKPLAIERYPDGTPRINIDIKNTVTVDIIKSKYPGGILMTHYMETHNKKKSVRKK